MGEVTTSEEFIFAHDPDPPILLNLPMDLTLPCGSEIPPPPVVTGYDLVTGDVEVIMRENESERTCGGYIVRRSWTARDECDNVISGVQTITFEDGEPPTLEVPADTTIYCPGEIPEAHYLAASDACSDFDVLFSETKDYDNGNDCEFSLTRTWIAIDACGNSTVEEQVITFRDTTPPTITIVNPMIADVPNGGDFIMYGCDNPQVAMSDIIASDECCDIASIVTDDVLKASDVCDLYGYYRRWECSFEATDAAGNTSRYYFNVLQYDTTAPEIHGIEEPYIEVACDSVIPPIPTGVYGYDACLLGNTPEYSENQYFDPADSSQYAIVRTWSMEDHCGNIGEAHQIVAVCGFDTTLLESTLGNMVWLDANVDGIQGEDETGLDGVKVYLLRATNKDGSHAKIVDSTITSSINGISGSYEFEHLKSGMYQISIVTPSEMTLTNANVGENDDIDSDVDPVTATSQVIEIGMQESIMNYDIGLMGESSFDVSFAGHDIVTVNCQNQISWTTDREIGLEYFEVQRSADGRNFEKLGTLRAHGHSAQKLDYTFLDAQPLNRGFYRLMLMPKSGTEKYTGRKAMKLACGSEITSLKLFPNPTVEETTIEIELASRTEVVFEIYNKLGQRLNNFSRNLTQGVHREKIDLVDLPNGVYWISIKVDGHVRNETVIKNGKTF